MTLDAESQRFEQQARPLRVRLAVPWRIVCCDFDQLGEKRAFRRKVAIHLRGDAREKITVHSLEGSE